VAAESLRVLVHASELLTGEGIRDKDGRLIEEHDVGQIHDAALVYSVKQASGREIPAKIRWVGRTTDLPRKFLKARRTDLKLRRAVIPGLVDAHTHLVFAGDRSSEFARRCGGATYEEIAREGGGILRTVTATRAATEEELFRLACNRVREAMGYGIRTIELKSGYGLNHETELKQLRVAKRLKREFPEVLFQSTYLGAHAVPKGLSKQEYLDEMLRKTLPEVAARKLADACDVFIDEGYFTCEEGARILQAAAKAGLQIKVHADELSNTASSELAARLGALSADHLLQISDTGIEALAHSDTTAVILPGTAFYLKAAHAPARRLIERGARVALASDFNPGTCMTLNLPAVMTIAALYLGLSRAELFAAVTYNAACALGFQERRGTLEPGLDAAFAILPFERFEELYYRFAWPSGATAL
jgi:imidazolonepropionase